MRYAEPGGFGLTPPAESTADRPQDDDGSLQLPAAPLKPKTTPIPRQALGMKAGPSCRFISRRLGNRSTGLMSMPWTCRGSPRSPLAAVLAREGPRVRLPRGSSSRFSWPFHADPSPPPFVFGHPPASRPCFLTLACGRSRPGPGVLTWVRRWGEAAQVEASDQTVGDETRDARCRRGRRCWGPARVRAGGSIACRSCLEGERAR